MENLWLFGLLGAVLPDVIRIIKNRHEGKLPEYIRQGSFWLGFALLLGLGSLAAFLGEPTDVKQALAYGYGAPELVSRLFADSAATKSWAGAAAGTGATKLSLRGIWAS